MKSYAEVTRNFNGSLMQVIQSLQIKCQLNDAVLTAVGLHPERYKKVIKQNGLEDYVSYFLIEVGAHKVMVFPDTTCKNIGDVTPYADKEKLNSL